MSLLLTDSEKRNLLHVYRVLFQIDEKIWIVYFLTFIAFQIDAKIGLFTSSHLSCFKLTRKLVCLLLRYKVVFSVFPFDEKIGF